MLSALAVGGNERIPSNSPFCFMKYVESLVDSDLIELSDKT
jgi:hypothetical protein